jgi:phosphoribosylanthranilate isomerase
MKIKICGMRDPDNIRAVAATSPDFMGFIFYPKSPRWVGESFEIPSDLPATVKTTGVFVHSTTEDIVDKIEQHGLKFVQLHGDESRKQCNEIRKTGVGIIKVFTVDVSFDLKRTHAYKNSVDYFLFDTRGNNYGGNGIAFDWTVLDNYDLPVGYFLSGGLSLENIGMAVGLTLPGLIGFDFNSGVEMSPGIKDVMKIRAIETIVKPAVPL